MPKKSKIEIFKELYEANIELWLDIDSMNENLELNKINSLSWILRKLICDNTRATPLLLDLVKQENYPIYFYALFDENESEWCILSLPFWNWQFPSISLNKIDFSQKIEINDWLNKTILKNKFKYKKWDKEIEKINYSTTDIILLYANNKWVHSDIKINEELKSLEWIKITNDYFSNIERCKKFLFDFWNVLNIKITEFIEYFEIKHKWNPELINFYYHQIENLTKKINIKNNNSEYYYERAVVYYKLNKFTESLEDINKCLELSPQLQHWLFQKAILLHNKNKYSDAIDIYNNLIQNGYIESTIFNNLWNVYLDNWEFDLAIDSYNKSLSINDSFILSIYWKWKTYRIKWDYQNAIFFLNNPFLSAFQPNINEELWLSYMLNKEYDKAIEEFKKAILCNKDEKSYYLNLWNCLNEKWKYKEAIIEYDKALEIDKNYLLAFFNKWNSNLKHWLNHLEYKRKEKAIEYLQKALDCYNKVSELDDNYELLHSNKAQVMYNLWYDFIDIIEIINKWIKLYPNKENNYLNKLIFLEKFWFQKEYENFEKIYLEKFKWNKLFLN